VTCFPFALTHSGVMSGFADIERDWLPPKRLRDSAFSRQYIESLYSALGLTLGVVEIAEPQGQHAALGHRVQCKAGTGQPFATLSRVPSHLPGIGEIAFHVVVMIVSLLVFAYTIGVVSAIEESTNERALRFQAQQQYVRLVLKNHKLTPGLVSRVTAYLSYQFHNQNNFDASIMEGIPEGLQVRMVVLST
jgi:predicted membrane metal-binding protein